MPRNDEPEVVQKIGQLMPTAVDTSQIKVMIVDDQEVLRRAFGMLLSNEPTLNLVGVLADGESAVQMVPALKPDVIIMDVKMPGLNGIAAAKRIREGYPEVGIILLSGYDDSDYIWEFLKDNPQGKSYLLKHTLGMMDELIRTIHDVAAGRTVLDPIIVGKLTAQRGISKNSDLKDLTQRELEVLSLMAKACTNSTIASILYIQLRTVEHHISKILSKLGIEPGNGQHARVEAVLAYLKASGQSHQDAFGPESRYPPGQPYLS